MARVVVLLLLVVLLVGTYHLSSKLSKHVQITFKPSQNQHEASMTPGPDCRQGDTFL